MRDILTVHHQNTYGNSEIANILRQNLNAKNSFILGQMVPMESHKNSHPFTQIIEVLIN